MRQLVNRILSYLPTRLPVGLPQFNAWLESIVGLCGPIADPDSLRWVISNEIMRMPPAKDRVAKNDFVKLVRKYAANQLAAHTVMEIKKKQEAAQKEAEKQQAEATALQQVASSEEKI